MVASTTSRLLTVAISLSSREVPDAPKRILLVETPLVLHNVPSDVPPQPFADRVARNTQSPRKLFDCEVHQMASTVTRYVLCTQASSSGAMTITVVACLSSLLLSSETLPTSI